MNATASVDVVKRKGARSEPFSRQKLHASLVAACFAVRSVEGEAELAANRTCQHVEAWLATHPIVTSNDLRRVAAKFLQKYHPEAAFYYSRHKHIL